MRDLLPAEENKIDAKIRVDETETPILFVRVEKSDPPQVVGLKAGQTIEAEFSLGGEGDADMKDESQP